MTYKELVSTIKPWLMVEVAVPPLMVEVAEPSPTDRTPMAEMSPMKEEVAEPVAPVVMVVVAVPAALTVKLPPVIEPEPPETVSL